MRNTKPYCEEEVDAIGAYDSINKNFYLIPLKEILPRKEIWIRVDQVSNNQEKNINWAIKYKI